MQKEEKLVRGADLATTGQKIKSYVLEQIADKVSSDDIDNVVELTKAQYDALATKDARTMYIISDSAVDSDHVGIAKFEQTTKSTAPGGTNIWTVTLTNNQTFTLAVMNGTQGNSGYSGAAGELEVVNNVTQGGATAALSAEMGKTLEGEISQLGLEVTGASWTESHFAGGGTYELATPLHSGDIITEVEWNGVARIVLKSDSSGTITQYVYPADLPYTCGREYTHWTAYKSGSPTVTMTIKHEGVKNTINDVDTRLTNEEENLNGEEIPPTATGAAIKLTGAIGSTVPSPTTNADYAYIKAPVTPGDIIYIPKSGSSATYGGALSFVDSENKLVTNAKAAQTATNVIVQVPDGVAEVIINKGVNDPNPILFKQGTKGWALKTNELVEEGIDVECGYRISRELALLQNPARVDGSNSNSGAYGGYSVDLTGLYPKYKYIYFRGANFTLASNIVRGIILDANGNIESSVPNTIATSDGWQVLPITANSKKLWATYVYSTYGPWLPEYVILQSTNRKIVDTLSSLEGSLDILDSIEDESPILPKEIHAVLGEKVLFFKNALTPGNPDNLILSVANGRNFKRYMNYIPTAVGSSVLNATVKDISKQCNIKVVDPSNPSSAKNILVVGASAVANYATLYEELYRRLALTTGNENVTEFGVSIKDPTNPRGLGLSNIHFVGRKTNGNHFNYEATGGYTFANYYGEATTYNYSFIVADTSAFVDGAVYSDGTHDFTISEISGTDHRISMQCATQGVSLPSSGTLTKVSGDGASSLAYSEYTATLTRPFLNPTTGDTSLQYYMDTYCDGANVDIVVFNGLMFNSGYNWTLLENNAKPLARIIHTEYPNAKMIFCTNALVDTRGFGEAYVYKSTTTQGQTKKVNDATREFIVRLDALCDELNDEFGSAACVASYVGLQCDSENDYPLIEVPVNNRNTSTEYIGTNGVHPTTSGILNQIDALYRSICYVIATYFN